MEDKDIKQVVKEKYGEIAKQPADQAGSSCCGSGSCCSSVDFTTFREDYQGLKGYSPDADMGLGCGIPTQYAGIKKGDSVLDLGSGAGNDCFVARAIVGDQGQVTGLDFTEEMLVKANGNNKKLGYTNVRFVRGDIEEMPLPGNQFDVVISNCVLNLVPDKQKAFSEIFRVLKPGGHFCISDVVIKGFLPEKLREDAELYVGCVSGAIDMDEYLGITEQNGFRDIKVHRQKEISLPDELLKKYLTCDELELFRNGKIGIYSIKVSGFKQ
ncbi:MAG TPA: arsenite methyltransferase [Bacteroidales bacterium]|nr:arsenite methyltransferase [Bacteroidales bacterium]HRW85214.1 arsenite methyltransferase [Bacteroidales bacterium]